LRGAKEAATHSAISYLGFPLSLSETFQQRNTNKSIDEAFSLVDEIQEICIASNKKQVVYISMGFGNPYGDPYEMDYVCTFVEKLQKTGISIISLADTVGVSNPDNIRELFQTLSLTFPSIEFGAHLHTDLDTTTEKIDAAYKAGCRRFDGAINGFGGCPMANDALVGNMATEKIIDYLKKCDNPPAINYTALHEAMNLAPQVFLNH
jgi:hydroxymethylglutaryl-CoA lyase